MEPSSLSILQKCKQVLAHPSALFETVKDERGIGPAFKYLAVFFLVSMAGNLTYLFFPLDDIPLSEISKTPFFDELTRIGIIMVIPHYVLNLLVLLEY